MNWEIRDETGVIHSGTEEEMRKAWDVMTNPDEYSLKEIKEWQTDWEGDIELLQVHAIHR